VIAIIGILAAVVLGSLNDARDNANDASAQTSINNVRNVAEVYYSESGFTYGTGDSTATQATPAAVPGTVDNVCDSEPVVNLMNAASAQTRNTTNCFATDNAYAVEVDLRSDGATNSFYCIDSTGFAGTRGTSSIAAADVVCG